MLISRIFFFFNRSEGFSLFSKDFRIFDFLNRSLRTIWEGLGQGVITPKRTFWPTSHMFWPKLSPSLRFTSFPSRVQYRHTHFFFFFLNRSGRPLGPRNDMSNPQRGLLICHPNGVAFTLRLFLSCRFGRSAFGFTPGSFYAPLRGAIIKTLRVLIIMHKCPCWGIYAYTRR